MSDDLSAILETITADHVTALTQHRAPARIAGSSCGSSTTEFLRNSLPSK
jgi:hypothetical protein